MDYTAGEHPDVPWLLQRLKQRTTKTPLSPLFEVTIIDGYPGGLFDAHGTQLKRLCVGSLLHLVCDCIKVCVAVSH